MIKEITIMTTLVMSLAAQVAGSVSIEPKPEIERETISVETINTEPEPVTADPNAKVTFDRVGLTSIKAPEPEPEPEPAPEPKSETPTNTPSTPNAPATFTSTPAAPLTAPTAPVTVAAAVPTGSPHEEAQRQMQGYGWGADQLNCLINLWEKESNWNHLAMNPSSGAYGIPQSLPGNKMASAGADWQTNPATQIKWGLQYISERYGTPCGAWGHSQQVGWY